MASSSHFLDFPPEIITRVLYLLDLPDLSSVSATHSILRALVKDSQALQFRYEARDAAVYSNPNSSQVPAERLAQLRRLEEGWSKLNIDFRKPVRVEHPASGLYDLTAGVCILGNANQRFLHYLRLPSQPEDVVQWSKIDIGRQMVDFGLCIFEHDLIAVLTATPAPTQDLFMVEIRLIQFSTGKPHPLAKQPVLFVTAARWSRPSILIEIVDDHLVLVLTYPPALNFFLVEDSLYIFQWKTGVLKLSERRPSQTYHSVIFVSPTILCLPNARTNSLDIWLVPTDPIEESIVAFLQIRLPYFSDDFLILNSLCRAEPNHAPTGTPYSSQAFHANPEDAIAIFSFRVVDRAVMSISTLMMFMHRRELLKAVLGFNPDHSPAAMLELSETHVLGWESFGPGTTYWTEVPPSAASWITTAAGQRCVIASNLDGEEEVEQTITVLDFNPQSVKRFLRDAEAAPSLSEGELKREVVLDSKMEVGIFTEPVVSSLPFVRTVLPIRHHSDAPFNGILMDEERLLGIKIGDSDSSISEIEIMHIGAVSA